MFTLETKKKTINLVFKTRKIVNIANKLKGKNFEEVYFKAMNDLDIDALSKIIFSFAEMENSEESFKSSEEVFDFIDDYKEEKKKSYFDIFKEIAEAINKEGFFITKMTQKELEEKISNPMFTMSLEELVKPAVTKAVEKIIENTAEI